MTSIKSYVLRAARMSDSLKAAYAQWAPQWVIPFSTTELDWDDHFPGAKRRIVEIGFGMGDATRQIAQVFPEDAFLGLEVHRPGVAKLLWWIARIPLKNIKIIEHDAVEVLSSFIPKESVDAFHLWFPDPWPKKRHHKRRLLQAPFIALLHNCLCLGGSLHVVTDWESYAEEIYLCLEACPGVKNRYLKWAKKPAYRPQTKFEKRALLAGRPIRELIFEKCSR